MQEQREEGRLLPRLHPPGEGVPCLEEALAPKPRVEAQGIAPENDGRSGGQTDGGGGTLGKDDQGEDVQGMDGVHQAGWVRDLETVFCISFHFVLESSD